MDNRVSKEFVIIFTMKIGIEFNKDVYTYNFHKFFVALSIETNTKSKLQTSSY